MLHAKGCPPVYTELKVKGGKPSEAQYLVGEKLNLLGCRWSWVTSIKHYRAWLDHVGVPLVTNAEYQAMQADAKIEAAIAKAAAKKPARTAKPAPRFTVGKRVASRAARAGIRL